MKHFGLLFLAFLCANFGCQRAEKPPEKSAAGEAGEALRFITSAGPSSSLNKKSLRAEIPAETITGFDPYYKKRKRWQALPMRAVLTRGFGKSAEELAKEDLVLRALDGYEVPISGARLVDGSAYLAVADLDVPQWEPIGERKSSPAPFYLVWKDDEKGDLDSHPRPWALHEVELATFEKLYPHTVPPKTDIGAKSESVQRGFALYRIECIHCHAMNREGGRIGPELNVPRSIVEYRPIEQIRAYIRDPQSFRYSMMPAHPQLSDADLDALIAYFAVMSQHKYDPAGAKNGR